VFKEWKYVASQDENFTLQVPAQMRLTLDWPHDFSETNPSAEKLHAPGTYICNGSSFYGALTTWWWHHLCYRQVQQITVQEYQQQTTGHPYVDNRLDFLPRRGQIAPNMGSQGAQPGFNSQAKFRIICPISRMSNDDPIVYPGQPGKAHHHTFFGAVDIDASMVMPETGGSTCAGGTINRSGYWVPSIIDTRFGKAVVPYFNTIYYQQGYDGILAANIVAPPPGFRMIAGNLRAAFACPTGGGTTIPAACPAGSDFIYSIQFPRCWDGVNLDSADHKSHVAYSDSNGCPSTHPVAIPQISYNIHYHITADDDTSKWRLSSDDYAWSSPGGLSAHADWLNGWDQSKLQMVVTECLNAQKDCGSDGINGRPLYH
jgi:hypothetical protein